MSSQQSLYNPYGGWGTTGEYHHDGSSIHDKPIEIREENGKTIKRYAPGYAIGVRPQRNIGINKGAV